MKVSLLSTRNSTPLRIPVASRVHCGSRSPYYFDVKVMTSVPSPLKRPKIYNIKPFGILKTKKKKPK